jgi:hypothetical protein
MHSYSYFGRDLRDHASRVTRCGFAAMALMLGPNVAAADEVKWHMATEYPQSNIWGVGLSTFASSSATERRAP